MPVLTNAGLRMIAEVVTELAHFSGTSFDKIAKGQAFARAALIDPVFKERLVEVHRRLEARRATDVPAKLLGAHRTALPRPRTRCRGGAERMEGLVVC